MNIAIGCMSITQQFNTNLKCVQYNKEPCKYCCVLTDKEYSNDPSRTKQR